MQGLVLICVYNRDRRGNDNGVSLVEGAGDRYSCRFSVYNILTYSIGLRIRSRFLRGLHFYRCYFA